MARMHLVKVTIKADTVSVAVGRSIDVSYWAAPFGKHWKRRVLLVLSIGLLVSGLSVASITVQNETVAAVCDLLSSFVSSGAAAACLYAGYRWGRQEVIDSLDEKRVSEGGMLACVTGDLPALVQASASAFEPPTVNVRIKEQVQA